MREIEFRGKAVITNKWVYGFPIKASINCDNEFIQIVKKIEYETDLEYSTFADGETIIAETLGQFTGRSDKNGTKIFEGDIVEFETNINIYAEKDIKPYWKDVIKKDCVVGGGHYFVRKDQAIVQWNATKGMWDLKVYNNGRYKRKSQLFTFRPSDYVVIGNIHDNPELLEVSDDN